FFASVLGIQSQDLTATAAATIMGGVNLPPNTTNITFPSGMNVATVDSFSTPSSNISVLPMTFDVNQWYSFASTGLAADGSQTLASNGAPELQIYPSVKGAGNFGLLTLDDNHTGSSGMRTWIENGMASSDLSALKTASLLPLSQHNDNNWDWVGDPG